MGCCCGTDFEIGSHQHFPFDWLLRSNFQQIVLRAGKTHLQDLQHCLLLLNP
uniref:Uncharacterized protein n=1 Tax=Arundo donax TaxID=35708 RepID=A0A0A8Z5V1_ARUDO